MSSDIHVGDPLLVIEDLKLEFKTEEGTVKALDGINITVKKGEIHGVIGETGCGKSVTSLTTLGLLDNNARIRGGEVLYKGVNLLKMNDEDLRQKIRGNEISMIFQNPSTSLNPVYTAGEQIKESVVIYQSDDKKEAQKLVLDELDRVKLPDPEDVYDKYPHELSGGMQQRVMIAMMLACNSNLLIADEPTTALDVSIQAQFLKILRGLKESRDLSILYITHDMAVISEICDVVTVMYGGQIAEKADVHELFKNPKHPYTIGLIHSVPGVMESIEEFETIPGTVPRLINPPSGCRFHPRCEYAREICKEKKPELEEIEKDHFVACHFWEEVE
ncbi:MAG: ABC transporter ATP-binding protein [Candidatus Thermoplasmatota archaeon]|nr:ABC transporter ATP-binding protein [Candidatus Thermoplasmatota archaeon]